MVLPGRPLSLDLLTLPCSAPPFPPAVTPSFLCLTQKNIKYKRTAHSPSVLEKGSAQLLRPLTPLFLFSSVHTCPRPSDERPEQKGKHFYARKPTKLKGSAQKEGGAIEFFFVFWKHFISTVAAVNPQLLIASFLQENCSCRVLRRKKERRHRAGSARFCLPVVGGKSAERKLMLIHTMGQCGELTRIN